MEESAVRLTTTKPLTNTRKMLFPMEANVVLYVITDMRLCQFGIEFHISSVEMAIGDQMLIIFAYQEKVNINS